MAGHEARDLLFPFIRFIEESIMSEDRADFLIDRSDLRKAVWQTAPSERLAQGQARLRIARFALTANNITYAVLGDKFRYWDFFPAPDGFGRMPVWGFADVVESRADGLAPGERVYGYFPISTELVVTVSDLSPSGFSDASLWRADLSAVYNRYQCVTGDPAFSGASLEALQAVFRPLFATSFLIEDFLADNAAFGAEAVLISSASAKTSLALGFLLKQAKGRTFETIGLTSTANAGFVSGTGYYDRTIDYADIDKLARVPSIFIDMAGSAALRSAVHHHFGDTLQYDCAVGNAHWEDPGRASGLPGPRPAVFFAPGHVDKKTAIWGVDGYERRLAEAWEPFCASVRNQLEIVPHSGQDAIAALYHTALEGKLPAQVAAMGELR